MFRSYWRPRVVKAAALPARASATSVVSFSRWVGILVLGAGKRPAAPPAILPYRPRPGKPAWGGAARGYGARPRDETEAGSDAERFFRGGLDFGGTAGL